MNVFVQILKSLKNGQHLNGKNSLKKKFFIFYFINSSIITSIKNNTDKVQIDLSRIPSFEKILVALEGQLLDGHIFQVEKTKFIFFVKIDFGFFRIVLNKYLIRVLLLQKILYYKKNLQL